MLLKFLSVRLQYPSFQQTLRKLATENMGASARVKVQVKQGVVVGQERRLPNGSAYSSYLGVPYAVPPLGALRFKSPLPLERFMSPELDCTRHRDVSHHRDPLTTQISGSEDCLFLNVYTPKARSPQQSPLPVMVFIHGGGFWFGSGNSDYYLPLRLLEEQVVVVTLNYRLGALGFLSLPEEGVWGNAGLKDQRLALQWVQENISQFNGDPQNVTLFGESAGAACVHLHTYARHAQQLFHKAIMQSGTANAEWVFQANPGYKTRRLAELLGCTSKSTHDIITRLQSNRVSPLDILANTLPVLTPDERRRGLPLAFKPIIEDATSPDSFIDAPILELLQRKDTLAMPTIMGYNSAEGITMLVNAVRKLPELNKDLARFVPRNIPLAPDSSDVQELARQMRDFYVGSGSLSPKSLDGLTALLGDYHFIVDMQQAAEWQARLQPRAPLYFYRFNYVGGRNMYKRIFQLERLQGACHGEELFYLFQMENDEIPHNAEDELCTQRMCGLWADFARYGEPTAANAGGNDFAWTPVQCSQREEDAFVLDYLSIDKECRMQQNPEQERMEFWRNIYRQHTATDYSRLSAKL